MGKQNNRTCIICGKSYHFCPTCGEDSGKPSWYFIFDDKNCHDIYETCVAYRDKNITIAEAQKRIKELNIDGLILQMQQKNKLKKLCLINLRLSKQLINPMLLNQRM